MQKRISSPYSFKDGFRDSVPIGVGYLSVSFGFGITAVGLGLPALLSVIISMTNMTSAGQLAGAAIIASGGTFIEMALTQLTISLRYLVMGISLSQKLDDAFSPLSRAAAGFGMTDEIFAMAASKPAPVGSRYMFGLISFPYICWSVGTTLGAVAGNIMPAGIKNALGIAVFSMLIAIVTPAARKDHGVALAAILASALSCALAFIPLFSFVTDGFSIIICGTLAAGAAALLFPIDKPQGVREEVVSYE